ncbi:MAG: mechanosensitive ion channel [Candidatus Methanoperedens sp.]|nr:mechanosensitive ion channel [Candidatus Methanoperedens sp.]
MEFISGLKVFFLILLTGSIAYINYFVSYNPTLIKAMYSVVILLIAYVISIFIDNIIKKQIKETRERYSIRKAVSTVISIVVFGAILGVWLQETTTLVVAFGLLSAGIAIALQDLLRNVAGGLIIFITKPFSAGDRIQVDNDLGDVIDLKIFYTTIMEIREWVDGDQYSGRIFQIPNSFILNKTVKNYTRDFSFIWDEITIMLTYESNYKKAQEIIKRITHEITVSYEEKAKKELEDLGEKYFINQADVEENIYTKITDNWIDLHVRYVVDPRKRRLVRHLLSEKILEEMLPRKDMKIASATFEIVGFPPVKLER